LRIKNSLNNIITGLFGQLLLTVTGFITRTIFIHVLGSTYLGINGLFSNILTVLSFAELGVGQAIIFSLYKPIAENDEDKICSLMQLYSRVYRILFFVVLILGLIMLPLLPYIINDMESIPNIRLIYIMYVANSAFSYLFSYKGAFVSACQKNYIINLISYFSNILLAVIQIVCLNFFRNYLVYLGVQIGFGIVQNIIVYHCADKLFPFLKRKDVKPLEYGERRKIKDNIGALIIYKIGSLALNSTDNIIISSFVGVVAVGIYSNYLLLQTSVSSLLSTVFSNLTASIGNLNAGDDKDKKVFLFYVINLVTFWLYAVCSICLFICMTPFVHIWIGDDYILPTSVSLIIAVNMYIGGMLYAPFNFRQTLGIFVEGKMRPIFSAVINIVASIIFAKLWGVAGVLWGTAVARLSTNVWFDPYMVFKRGLHVSPVKYYVDYIWKAFIFLFLGITCTILTQFIPDSNIALVFLKAVIAFVVSNVIIFLLYRRSDEFKYLWIVGKNLSSIMRGKI